MKKNNIATSILCIASLLVLPGCFGGKKKEAVKVEKTKKANTRSKEIIEENIS